MEKNYKLFYTTNYLATIIGCNLLLLYKQLFVAKLLFINY